MAEATKDNKTGQEKHDAQLAQDNQAAAEAANSDEARHSQEIASTRAGIVRAPGRAPQTEEETKRADERREEANSLAGHLADLDRNSLAALSAAVEHATRLRGGLEPVQAGPTVREIAAGLPLNAEASKDLKLSSLVSKLEGVEEHEIVSAAVRQARGVSGFIGPQYLQVVTSEGQKHAAIL